MNKQKKKKVVVAVSGGFDPIHIGHIRMFQDAKKLGDELVVILNNDNWLKEKKGHIFMSETERKELLEALSPVDRVVLTNHPAHPQDMTVCRELSEIRPHIFANGGDRIFENTPEGKICEDIGCKTVFGVGAGGKIQSSSWLLEKYMREKELKARARAFSSKKGIVFDLDGTLAPSKLPMDAEMVEIIGNLLEKRKVAVIGGGHFGKFQDQFLGMLSRTIRNDNLFLFPTSGGELYQRKNGEWKRIYSHALKSGEKKKIFTAFERSFQSIGYVHPEEIFGNVLEDRTSQITFSALGQQAPLEKKEVWNRERDIRKKLRASLMRHLPEYEIRLGGFTSMDVTKKGIDKAFGIQEILTRWNMQKRDLLYIGDALYPGGNDAIVKKTGIATLQVKNPEETKTFLRFFLEGIS